MFVLDSVQQDDTALSTGHIMHYSARIWQGICIVVGIILGVATLNKALVKLSLYTGVPKPIIIISFSCSIDDVSAVSFMNVKDQ